MSAAANDPYEHMVSDEISVWGDDGSAEPDPLDDLMVHREPEPIEVPPPRPTTCAEAGIEATVEAMRLAFELSAHHCACGEKLLHAGTCNACRERERERNEALVCVARADRALPPRYRGNHLGNPELARRVRDGEAIERAKAAAKNPAIDRVVLAGPAGIGKTSLAAAVLCQMAYGWRLEAFYCSASELSRARSASRLGEEPELVQDALAAGVLLLDDVGLDNPQQHGSAVVDVVFARHREQRPTIVTLAVPPQELAARYGDGLGRRLLEDDGSCVLIELRP